MSTGPAPDLAGTVLGRLRAVAPEPAVVAIDGHSGSGKTTLAARLTERLPDSVVVHLEDLYPGWDGLAAAPALIAAQVLEPLRRGEPAGYRRFDWEHHRFAERVAVPSARWIILEGVGSSVRPAAQYADLRVWLDAPEPVRRDRALARDGQTYAPHWARWAAQEAAVFAADDTRAHADVVLRSG